MVNTLLQAQTIRQPGYGTFREMNCNCSRDIKITFGLLLFPLMAKAF